MGALLQSSKDIRATAEVGEKISATSYYQRTPTSKLLDPEEQKVSTFYLSRRQIEVLGNGQSDQVMAFRSIK